MIRVLADSSQDAALIAENRRPRGAGGQRARPVHPRRCPRRVRGSGLPLSGTPWAARTRAGDRTRSALGPRHLRHGFRARHRSVARRERGVGHRVVRGRPDRTPPPDRSAMPNGRAVRIGPGDSGIDVTPGPSRGPGAQPPRRHRPTGAQRDGAGGRFPSLPRDTVAGVSEELPGRSHPWRFSRRPCDPEGASAPYCGAPLGNRESAPGIHAPNPSPQVQEVAGTDAEVVARHATISIVACLHAVWCHLRASAGTPTSPDSDQI